MGYEAERARVIENTLQFLKGFPANNALFYGDRGTGKSSTVKALLNEYYSQGLRMIEVPKTYLTDFPLIISLLKNRPEKFIIFVDDLAFEESGENYNALKAVLEGGLENRPNNVLIYATSNRRHLVKESFKDRAGLQSNNQDDEVRAADNIQEKLSLSDRFGITVTFAAPSQNKYLQIVEGIAEKRNLKFDKEKLYQEALKWQMRYNGRSPRTAKQFIDWVEGSQGLGE
jgi:predicted AAA+ superfamily ATPase